MRFTLSVITVLLLASFAFGQKERDDGIALYKKGDYRGAANLLQQATKSAASDAQVWYFLGLSYLKKDKNKEAEKAFQKAVALDPQNTKMRIGLALVYLLRNNSTQAQRGGNGS